MHTTDTAHSLLKLVREVELVVLVIIGRTTEPLNGWVRLLHPLKEMGTNHTDTLWLLPEALTVLPTTEERIRGIGGMI
jgi:hypothetical protein